MLTSDQTTTLRGNVQAGDRIAYYDALADWGYVYGELALGVARHDTTAGRTANDCFVRQANAERPRDFTNDELARLPPADEGRLRSAAGQ